MKIKCVVLKIFNYSATNPDCRVSKQQPNVSRVHRNIVIITNSSVWLNISTYLNSKYANIFMMNRNFVCKIKYFEGKVVLYSFRSE